MWGLCDVVCVCFVVLYSFVKEIKIAAMDERAQYLLKTLVERYIADGQPVGSRTLSKASGLELSPATIRNVMADLEEMGLIASPHVSAGRVPTPKGYRLFVDMMLTAHQADERMVDEVKRQVELPELPMGAPKQVLNGAAQMLSELSHFAGVVMAPRKNTAFRHIEFLRLSARRILVIIVAKNGDVQNRIIYPGQDYAQSDLIEAANYLNTHFSGMDFETVRLKISGEIEALRSEIMELLRTAVASGSGTQGPAEEQVVVSGQHHLLEVSDLAGNLDALRKLFDLFEQKAHWLQLLDVSDKAEGVRIFIGGESHVVPFDELSVVTAPYEVNGEVVGALGVIGPTRMAYDRMIQIVDITSRLVSNALSYEQD